MHGRNKRTQTLFLMRMLSTKSFEITKILLLTNCRFLKNMFSQGIVKIGDLLSNMGSSKFKGTKQIYFQLNILREFP